MRVISGQYSLENEGAIGFRCDKNGVQGESIKGWGFGWQEDLLSCSCILSLLSITR